MRVNVRCVCAVCMRVYVCVPPVFARVAVREEMHVCNLPVCSQTADIALIDEMR